MQPVATDAQSVTQMHQWYMDVINDNNVCVAVGLFSLTGRFLNKYFLHGSGTVEILFEDLRHVFHLHRLSISMIRAWTLHMYQCARDVREPVALLDPLLISETNINGDAQEVVEYLFRAMVQLQKKKYILGAYHYR